MTLLKLSRLKFILIMCLLILGSTSSFTKAQNNDNLPEVDGITISPPLKELVLGPGLLEAHTNVTVTNTTGQEVTASIRLVDFQALNEFGGVSLGQVGGPSSKYGLAQWMSLPNGVTYKIQNGKTATIPITVANTDDLRPGGHYGAAIVSISDPITNGANSIAFKREVASLLFVKKLGGEVYGLELESLKTDKPTAIPETVTMKFKGTGNVHVVPRGYIEVTDPRGRVVSKGIINPESTLVLPESSRQFVTIMQPVSNSSSWGRYTVTAYYRYDGKDDFDSHQVYFNRGISRVTSAGIIATLLVVIFMSVAVSRKLTRRRKYRRLTKR